MKWTEYAIRGYHRIDYDEVSQWERLKYIIVRIRGRGKIVTLGVTLMLWPFSWWEWGIEQSQEYDSLGLGPLSIWAAI